MKPSVCSQVCATTLLVAVMGLILSCHKGFLDKKPNTTLVIPTTLPDFQALLDNNLVFGVTPTLGEMSADNFYLVYDFWQNHIDTWERNAYLWSVDIFGSQGQVDDWDVPYQQVFYTNVVLEGLPNVKADSTNLTQWNIIKGSALFTRAYAFYNLAQLFAPVYDGSTASTDLGIPLRLTADINAKTVRSSVKQTYDQILSDLLQAVSLLPATIPFANLNHPSRPAAQALLARVYLSMRNYDSARVYANGCLQSYDSLTDYNNLDTATTRAQPLLTNEIIYRSSFLNYTNYTNVLVGLINTQCIIDSGLYRSYAANDLRRNIFYKISPLTGSPYLNRSYNGSLYPFSGLATDEMFLVRAECEAWAYDTLDAMKDLNALLKTRWKAGTFTSLTASSRVEALDTIRLERRKELAFRGLRWTDLRRLNKEGANITLTRNLNGVSYALAPNSNLYTLPIPPDVIAFSGIQQNQRP